MLRHPARLLYSLLLAGALCVVGVASFTDPAGASATATATAVHSKGGPVRSAWPARGAHRPSRAITRWMARQVGPRTPVLCSKRPVGTRARCTKDDHRGPVGASAAMSSSVARPGAITPETEKVALRADRVPAPLQLIRSYDIPVGDPSYDRLLNWSWTYDSAVSATAFATADLQDQSGRLLDQLAALQGKDGSIDFAFNVMTGESSGTVRAGSIAFAAMAFGDYDSTFGGTLYVDNARRAVDYLLSLRGKDGLVRGGPDVEWVSTQHNILTLIAITSLVQQLEGQGDEGAAANYREAAEGIAKGIDSELIVRDDQPAHFREGVGDEIVPLDTQALGIVYALIRGDNDLAKQVYEYAQRNFAVDGRSIELSKKTASYNMTYEAKGPFSGYRPYLGKNAPDVIWFEGTAEMRFVSTFLGQPTDVLDASMNNWWDATRKQGLAPLGANRTLTTNAYNEYHVWPTAAAGAWAVLSGAATDTNWANPAK
jgi:hypothetical protein